MDNTGAMMLTDRGPAQVVELQDVIDHYNLLTVEPTHMVIADKAADTKAFDPFAMNSDVRLGEIGGGSFSSYGAMLRYEYNPKLRGVLGIRLYDEMRRSDGQVQMALKAIKTPVLAARWYMEPVSQSRQDKKISDFIGNNLFKWMSHSWPQTLNEILGFADFGHYSFEKVFAQRPDGMIYWQKFATRHPLDLYRWEYDDKGGPTGGLFYGDSNMQGSVFIPIEKLLVFVNNRESGDLDGRSALRPVYKHWFYKENLYKVDAIQKERHGIGIPIIKLPPNYSSSDKAAADNLGRNLRTNEKAHVTLPPMWDLLFAELKGQPVECMTSIKHHDTQIARSMGAFYMTDDPGGAITDSQELFIKSSRFMGEIVKDVINKWAIPELCHYNWPKVEEYPELRVRRIGDITDWRQISFAIRNFVGAGVLIPDEPLEDWVREEMDLPARDPKTSRTIGTPQLPGMPMEVSKAQAEAGEIPAPQPPNTNAAGQPSQSTAKNMQKGTGNNGRVGQDGQGAGK